MGSSTPQDENNEMLGEDRGISVAPEQLRYSTFLTYGAWCGIIIMLVTYTLYVSGILAPYVPLGQLPRYWSMSSEQYLTRAGVPQQWGWIMLLGYGDFINFIGIAMMGFLTVVGLLLLVPAYMRKRDWIFLLIVCLQLIVIIASVSGVLTRLA